MGENDKTQFSFIFCFFNYASGRASPASIENCKILANNPSPRTGPRGNRCCLILLVSPNVPQFIITAAASDFVPLGPILFFKPTHKGPNTQSGNQIWSNFFHFATTPPAASNRLFIHFAIKRSARTERSSDEATGRPSDRSTDSTTERSSDRPGDKPSRQPKPLVIFKINPVSYTHLRAHETLR